MMTNYIVVNGELYHHGVKGMKWGVRRYQNKDGSLTEAGVKKYAKKQYAKDSLNSNTTALGKAYDRYSGAHKINADMKVRRSSKKQNEAAANKYLSAKKQESKQTRAKAKKVAIKGAEKTAKILNKVGKVYLTDQLFFGGAGTKLAKATAMTAGRAAVTAFVMARGGYDIKWYDKQGRRVG